MKLPRSKRKAIRRAGGKPPDKGAGGGARARVRQFEEQRGVKQTGTEGRSVRKR
jgi:hypothetical protein